MRRRSLLGAASALLFAAGSLPAQDQAKICASVGDVDVGHWVEYQIGGAAGQDVSSIRFAVVGTEASHYWYEFQAATNQGPLIVQLLVPDFPFVPGDVKGLVLKAGTQPAMKIPLQMLTMMQQQMGSNPMLDFAKQCAAARVVGREAVSVPAGTFQAWHVQNPDQMGEAWISDELPFGVVKGRQSDGREMVLTGYGTGATSSITETPQEMPGMPPAPSGR